MKKIIIFYSVFSAFFWLLVAGLFFYRVFDARSTNTRASMHGFEKVRQTIEHSYGRDRTFDSTDFKGVMRELFDGYPELHILVVYSYDTGIEYLKARSSGNFTSALPDLGSVRGVPHIIYNAFSQTKISSSITIPRSNSFIIEGVFTVLDETDLFPIFRDSLIALGSFILVTVTVFILFNAIDRKEARATKSSPRAERPAPVHTQPAQTAHAAQAAQPAQAAAPAPEARRDEGCPEPALEKRLTLELERAAFNEQDCSFTLISFSGMENDRDRLALAKQQIISKLAFEDLVFEYKPGTFGAILVNTNLEQGIKLLEDYQRKLDKSLLAVGGAPRCGITSRNGRLVEGKRLVMEAERALEKTLLDKKNIMGFKPDPGKYRQYVSKIAIQ